MVAPMWPIAFSIGTFQVGAYGVIIGVGILLCLWTARTLGKRDGLSEKSMNDLGLGVFISGLIGSWVLGMGINWVRGVPMDWSEFRNAGVIHGGLIGGALGLALLVRHFRLPLALATDAYIPAILLGQGMGRLGCFAAGCCFGHETSAPWGVTFSDPIAQQLGGVPLGVAVHPVQLYDASLHFVMFFGFLMLHRRGVLRGGLFGAWCIAEGLARLCMENFRGDLGRGVWLGLDWLSTGRVTAALFVVVGVMFLGRYLAGTSRPIEA